MTNDLHLRQFHCTRPPYAKQSALVLQVWQAGKIRLPDWTTESLVVTQKIWEEGRVDMGEYANQSLRLLDKRYSIIYADPPWNPVESGSGIRGTAGLAKRYKGVMKIEEICSLPIQEISNDDCILFLWVTFPRLLDGIKTINAWGFKYYGLGFVWIKLNKRSKTPFWGMGYYTRQNPEICLIATKGKKFKPLARNIHSVVMTPKEEHSKKPDIIRDNIVRIIGDLPRIELFARQRVDGWDAWGNEIDAHECWEV